VVFFTLHIEQRGQRTPSWTGAKVHLEAGLPPPGGGAKTFGTSPRTATLSGCGRVKMLSLKVHYSRRTGGKSDFLHSKTPAVERAMDGGRSRRKNGSRACGAQPTPPTASRQYAPSLRREYVTNVS